MCSDDFDKYKKKNRLDDFDEDFKICDSEENEGKVITVSKDEDEKSEEGEHALYYSKRTGKLLCVVMISKKIGGMEAPLSITY